LAGFAVRKLAEQILGRIMVGLVIVFEMSEWGRFFEYSAFSVKVNYITIRRCVYIDRETRTCSNRIAFIECSSTCPTERMNPNVWNLGRVLVCHGEEDRDAKVGLADKPWRKKKSMKPR
jgi:hypothetical protein